MSVYACVFVRVYVSVSVYVCKCVREDVCDGV